MIASFEVDEAIREGQEVRSSSILMAAKGAKRLSLSFGEGKYHIRLVEKNVRYWEEKPQQDGS
jgi:hypothetical protein